MARHRFDPIQITDDVLELTYFASVGEKQIIWYWDKKNYIWIPEGKIFVLAFLNDKYPDASSNDFKEVLFEVQKRTIYRDKEFRSNPTHIQFKKKGLDLETLDEEPANIEYHLIKKCDVELDLKAGVPREFIKALIKCQPDPQQLYLLLQAFACLFLVRTEDVDKIFLLVGEGQNGKSTILHVINKLLEPYISAVSMHDLINNRFALNELDDMLGNIYADISGIKIQDANILKLLTSGDLINIDRKYESMRKTRIAIVQFYSANKLPEIEDKSLAIARRMVPIEFNQKIKITDKQIKKKLTNDEQLKKILALLIRIARTTKRFGILNAPTSEEVLDILEQKGNPMVQFLSTSGYVKENIKAKCDKEVTYQLYTKFCIRCNFIVKSKRALSIFLASKGLLETRSGNTKYWQGLEANVDMLREGQQKL